VPRQPEHRRTAGRTEKPSRRSGVRKRGAPGETESLIAALSALAARVQRGRTTDVVLETAGAGVFTLGMRLVAFQVDGPDLVLRHAATSPKRIAAIEESVGRPLRGMRAPLASWELVRSVVGERQTIYRQDLDLFDRFLRTATGYDPTPLDAEPTTAGITNGVLAPLYVSENEWGILQIVSPMLGRTDADAVALFATQVASALEVAESIEALERANRKLANCYADLARTQQELVKRERLAALGELAAVFAHEVRNPLCVLFNAVASLRRKLDDAPPDVRMLLTIATEEAERMNHTVSDLLDFARPGGPQLETVSLPAILAAAVVSTTSDPAWKNVSIELDIPHDLQRVRVDPRMLQQALHNVLVNALEAMPRDGVLSVRAGVEAVDERDLVRIEIGDNGPGIPEPTRQRIFEPFFTTKASGTGLGLAVVKRVMDAHRGEVNVESGSSGTTVTLRLPTAI
jgi:two-component system, NtrC family, sensor histidine kinase HydH